MLMRKGNIIQLLFSGVNTTIPASSYDDECGIEIGMVWKSLNDVRSDLQKEIPSEYIIGCVEAALKKTGKIFESVSINDCKYNDIDSFIQKSFNFQCLINRLKKNQNQKIYHIKQLFIYNRIVEMMSKRLAIPNTKENQGISLNAIFNYISAQIKSILKNDSVQHMNLLKNLDSAMLSLSIITRDRCWYRSMVNHKPISLDKFYELYHKINISICQFEDIFSDSINTEICKEQYQMLFTFCKLIQTFLRSLKSYIKGITYLDFNNHEMAQFEFEISASLLMYLPVYLIYLSVLPDNVDKFVLALKNRYPFHQKPIMSNAIPSKQASFQKPSISNAIPSKQASFQKPSISNAILSKQASFQKPSISNAILSIPARSQVPSLKSTEIQIQPLKSSRSQALPQRPPRSKTSHGSTTKM